MHVLLKLVEMLEVTIIAVEGFLVEVVWKEQMFKQLPCSGHDMQVNLTKFYEDIVIV